MTQTTKTKPSIEERIRAAINEEVEGDDYRINLLEETITCLIGNNKKVEDVEYVGIRGTDKKTNWEQFAKYAKDIKYDNGYGGEFINLHLVIVGDDWWLERAEYDGSEWWAYKERPIFINHKEPLLFQDLLYCHRFIDIDDDEE
jgi:hypothetical protein